MILMGIINLTPDSFYGASRVWCDDGFDADALRARISDLLGRGCEILDLGAVSTRPGAADVAEEEEWRRLQPALKPAAEAAKLSVDTTRAGIVRKVYEEIGPFIVNDISAGEDDPQMLATVAELALPYVAMHKRGNPRSMDSLTDYPEGVTAAVMQYFREFEARAAEVGISDWILDPGFGFAKTSEQNWQLLQVRDICKYLDGKDEKALKQAAWEKKASLLLAITENYEMSIANKMRLAADRIQLKLLPEMKKIQEQAKSL